MPMITQEQISQMHNGLFHTDFSLVRLAMPSIAHIMDTCPVQEGTVDVKVHMLMPGQYPCIPGRHCDFVPRDADGGLRRDLVTPDQTMYLWVSGPPLTLFEYDFGDTNEEAIPPQRWVPFNQNDYHRGVASEEHCWRLFIRVVPHLLCRPSPGICIRRHTQVYLNAEEFKW